MKAGLTAAAILLLAGASSYAHRLDEYLQGAIVSVEKNRIQVQLTLTPGVAVLPAVLARIDSNADGVLSETEQRAYASEILHDLSLMVDGRRLAIELLSMQFPTIDEMKEGQGEIRIEFRAGLPRGGSRRSLIFKNEHQIGIAAYQVNCLVPRDPDIRIVAQKRNYSQSFYQLDFEQQNVPLSASLSPRDWGLLSVVALILIARFGLLWRRRMKHAAGRLSRAQGAGCLTTEEEAQKIVSADQYPGT